MAKECAVIGHQPINPNKTAATISVTYTQLDPKVHYDIEICRFCNALYVTKNNENKGIED